MAIALIMSDFNICDEWKAAKRVVRVVVEFTSLSELWKHSNEWDIKRIG